MSQFLLQKKLCFETGTHPPFGPMSQNTQFFFLKASLNIHLKATCFFHMGGGLTLRIFLSSRFWFVLYQRLFLGKLP